MTMPTSGVVCHAEANNLLPRDAVRARYVLRPCVCLSVSACLSQVGVLLKRLHAGSSKQSHTIGLAH